MRTISTPYYKFIDFLIIFISCSFSYWLRFDTLVLPLYYFLPAITFALISTFSLEITSFYQSTNSDFSKRQTIAAIGGLLLSAMLTIVCLYLTKTGENYSRIWFVTSFLVSFSLLMISRYVLNRVFNVSSNPRVIVILGRSNNSFQQDLIHKSDIAIAKTFDTPKKLIQSSLDWFQEVTNYIEEYRQNPVKRHSISEVWVTYDVFNKLNHQQLLSAFNDTSVRLVYIPEIPDIEITEEKQIQEVGGVLTLNSHFSKNKKLTQFLKFLIDQMIACCALILLSPLLIFIAILIKIDSQGPIFFKQLRYGFGGKSFSIWKFRTMYDFGKDEKFKQAKKNDPRITRVGKFLRRASLDELPQLINVVSGSMSIVGPRPHPDLLNEQYRNKIKSYMQRHNTKPGLTGLAQIHGFRGETQTPTEMQNRIDLDLEYITNWSLWLDIKIIFKTLHILFKHKGE